MTITIDVSGMAAQELQGLRTRLADSSATHSVIAGKAESFIKNFGQQTSQREHRTANRLGASPTNHLAKAYQSIEGQSDADSARLLVPRASRLRAAFGAYTARPTGGRKYLTIPVAAEAYGKRAGEIPGLVFMRVGPKKTALLAKPDGDGGITTYFLLVKKAEFKADPSLIPFEDLTSQSADAAELFILTGEIQS